MLPPRGTIVRAGLLGMLCVLVMSDCAWAGWMGFRNDTKEAIVIQETTIVNGRQKLGPPQKINAGEAIRDTQFCVGGIRKISVYSSTNPNVPIYTGNFPCPALNENVLYSLKTDAMGKVAVEAIKTAAGK